MYLLLKVMIVFSGSDTKFDKIALFDHLALM